MPTPQSPFWGRPCKARRPGACKPAVIANQCLSPAHTSFLQHVIASYVLAPADTSLSSACHCEPPLATADTPPPSACHCEPVRTLVRQSASPQECLASWLLFGQIRGAFQICPKYCFSFCAAARSTDCHVASLLAMTCKNLPPVRTIPGHCRCTAGKRPCTRRRVSVHVTMNRVLATADTCPSSACHCEPVRTLAWQSASLQKCLASWLLFGQIRSSCGLA